MLKPEVTCSGRWGWPRSLGESDPPIEVARCSGCDELMVVWKYRRFEVAPGSTDAEIVREVLLQRFEQRC